MLLVVALTAQTWTMVVGGDIMLNGVAPSQRTFAGIKKFVSASDIATANLEIPLTSSNTATSRKTPAELRARQQYILKANPGHSKWIADAGFDFVGLGNNHAMDYGISGLREETGLLKKAKIGWCGAGKDAAEATAPSVVTTKNGVKVAFVSFLAFRTPGGLWKCTPATDKSPGVATLAAVRAKTQQERLKSIVGRARKLADVVVVWLHWGTERKTVPDPFQVQLGRGFIDAGADCVLGAHPHVLQGAELYAGRPIFYSLGNLVSPLPGNTALFKLKFQGRKFDRVEILACSISGGRVAPVNLAAESGAKARFSGLCQASTKAYPSPRSSPLFPNLVVGKPRR